MMKRITQYILLSSFSVINPIYADDIDVYIQPPTAAVSPNILFVLDRSGSMNWGKPTSRMQRLKSAMTNLLNADDIKDVNVAIMSYSTRNPRMIKETGFQNVGNNRASMVRKVTDIKVGGGTPTAPALDAAVKWYQGQFQFNGIAEPSPFGNIPKNNWCKSNQIVLLSDGSPNSNTISHFPSGTECKRDPFKPWGGDCSQEIVKWAREQDFKTGNGWDIDLSEGKIQNIITHTIGFDTPAGSNLAMYLQGISDSGGGTYYPATSSEDLLSAFSSIAKEGKTTVDYSYSAPVIPYNPDHTAVTGDYIYIPLLKPSVNTFWKGNLKKYKLSTDKSGISIKDKNNHNAVNEDYTFVNSMDLWSVSNDEASTLVNGAARFQDSALSGDRNLYSNIISNVNLTHINNKVHQNNLELSSALLSVSNNNDREDILKWVNWKTPDKGFLVGADLLKGSMGASIHSQPSVVSYAGGDVVLISGSDGILKAIDAQTGQELWGYIPKDLLPSIKKIALNVSSTTPHYGLDGPMTTFSIDAKKYAVVGMRRGGSAYYALDITNRTEPKFAWHINNTGDFSQLGQTWSKPMFVKMHLSETDQNVLVFAGGYDANQDTATSRIVDDKGNVIYIVNPQTGKLIKKISHSRADLNIPAMTNSIAGDLLPVDINANGVIDRLYAADVGGRIIRVDIPDAKFTDKTLSGGIIADINSGNTGGFKRFFNTPEVGYFSKNGTQYLSILIGSGQRPEPLSDDVIDRFYMIKDQATWRAPFEDRNHNGQWDIGEPFNYHNVQAYEREITVSQSGSLMSVDNNGELYNATANLIQDGTASEKEVEKKLLYGEGNISASKGWFIDLSIGEKSMSKARLYNHVVLFTTYSGTRSNVIDLCSTNTVTGVSKLYAIDMSDASAFENDINKPNYSSPKKSNRTVVLNIDGIPPSSILTYAEDKSVRAMIGVEEILHFKDRFHAISWESVNE